MTNKLDIITLRLMLFINRMGQAATINPEHIRVLRREEAALTRELHIALVASL